MEVLEKQQFISWSLYLAWEKSAESDYTRVIIPYKVMNRWFTIIIIYDIYWLGHFLSTFLTRGAIWTISKLKLYKSCKTARHLLFYLNVSQRPPSSTPLVYLLRLYSRTCRRTASSVPWSCFSSTFQSLCLYFLQLRFPVH